MLSGHSSEAVGDAHRARASPMSRVLWEPRAHARCPSLGRPYDALQDVRPASARGW